MGLYLVLAVIYSLATPIGRGADEWAHYWYAQFIADHGRLPATPAERAEAGYKSDWPPLYHLFVAGLTGYIETDGPPTFKYRENNLRRQLIPAQGPEAILHTEDERFPWRQEVLVWHLGRFLSIAFSLGTLWVTYFIGLEVFTTLPLPNLGRYSKQTSSLPILLSLASVALLAFNPRFLFTGMLFNYDSLTLLLSSLFLWLLLRVVKGYHHRGFVGLGLLAGLALVTKYLAALLPLMIVAAALLMEVQTLKVFKTFRVWSWRLGQAALGLILASSWWFGYLLINFNEIETYGPVLGTVAPLLRGDGSDRTVEEIFAFISSGQAPPPTQIEKPERSVWQIIAELPLTFWGNPISQPYLLTWFVVTMTAITFAAGLCLAAGWRSLTSAAYKPGLTDLPRNFLYLLLLYSLLPLPFMLVRLFGARDALEAVQGRHILFLAGPAVAILLVWGLKEFIFIASHRLSNSKKISSYTLRFTFYVLLALLLTAAIIQLIIIGQTYPPLLPVQTQPHLPTYVSPLPQPIVLETGAKVIDYKISPHNPGSNIQALQVSLIWQGGLDPAQEDYQVELALVDKQEEMQANWRAYQTQARYPSRAWEANDVVRDEGWLPLAGLTAGDYEVRVRILGEKGPAVDWQKVSDYSLNQSIPQLDQAGWTLWQQGMPARRPPLLHERETAQLTFIDQANTEDSALASTGAPQISPASLQLAGPDGLTRLPVSKGERWANIIIGPDWPAGDYYEASQSEKPLFQVARNRRNFQIPEIMSPAAANFQGKIKLLGYDLPTRRVAPGEGLPITLYWQGLTWVGEELVMFNRLLAQPQDKNKQIVYGGYDRLPQENYSPLLWAPGEVVVDGFAIPIAPDAPDGVYMLNLGWYRQVNGQAESLALLNPETNEDTEATAVVIGPIKVGGPPPGVTVAGAAPQTEINMVLGEQIKLLGFDLIEQKGEASLASCPANLTAPATCSLNLNLYWQPITAPPADYTLFAHLRDTAGNVAAQKDQPPLNGAYPTSLWDTGEIIKDELAVPLEQLGPGRYELVVGLYDFSTGVRLSIAGSPDNSILLLPITIAAR